MTMLSFSMTLLIVSVAFISRGVATSFIHEQMYSGIEFCILALTLSALYCFIAYGSRFFGVLTSTLLLLVSIVSLISTPADQSTIAIYIVAAVALLHVIFFTKFPSKILHGNSHDQVDSTGTMIQAIFIAASFISLGAASVFEFSDPDTISFQLYFTYLLCAVLCLSVWAKTSMKLATLIIMIWACFYVSVYIKVGPFFYPIWMTTLFIHVAYLIASAWHLISTFKFESEDSR